MRGCGVAIGSLLKSRSATKLLIACALPTVGVALPLVLETFFVR
jgi:hypothetical protein